MPLNRKIEREKERKKEKSRLQALNRPGLARQPLSEGNPNRLLSFSLCPTMSDAHLASHYRSFTLGRVTNRSVQEFRDCCRPCLNEKLDARFCAIPARGIPIANSERELNTHICLSSRAAGMEERGT